MWERQAWHRSGGGCQPCVGRTLLSLPQGSPASAHLSSPGLSLHSAQEEAHRRPSAHRLLRSGDGGGASELAPPAAGSCARCCVDEDAAACVGATELEPAASQSVLTAGVLPPPRGAAATVAARASCRVPASRPAVMLSNGGWTRERSRVPLSVWRQPSGVPTLWRPKQSQRPDERRRPCKHAERLETWAHARDRKPLQSLVPPLARLAPLPRCRSPVCGAPSLPASADPCPTPLCPLLEHARACNLYRRVARLHCARLRRRRACAQPLGSLPKRGHLSCMALNSFPSTFGLHNFRCRGTKRIKLLCNPERVSVLLSRRGRTHCC